MSVWNEYNKKTCVNVIADKYRYFSMPKKEFRKFLNGFSWTHLKDYIKQKHEKEVKRSFKELPFYGALIEKPYTLLGYLDPLAVEQQWATKRLDDVDMLRELPFYDELNIVQTSKAFKGYARSYSFEVIDSKDQSVISRPSIKDLFKDLLTEIKSFKYQITLKVLLSKYKENAEREFAPVYFNSTTMAVITFKDNLDRFE